MDAGVVDVVDAADVMDAAGVMSAVLAQRATNATQPPLARYHWDLPIPSQK